MSRLCGWCGFSPRKFVAPLLDTKEAEAAEIGPETPQQRRNRAYQIRHDAALYHKNLPLPDHPTNGDEELYPNRIASYSKALPHNSLGEVDLAYNSLLRALTAGRPADFEAIVLGSTRKLVNPQAALAFELEGSDSHHLAMRPPPAFDSAEEASEIAELYWQALTRDVNYLDYSTNPLAQAADADLSLFSDFRGPKAGGHVTPATLFRGNTPGDLTALTSLSFSGKMFHSAPRPSTSASALSFLTMITWLPTTTGWLAGTRREVDWSCWRRRARGFRETLEMFWRDTHYEMSRDRSR